MCNGHESRFIRIPTRIFGHHFGISFCNFVTHETLKVSTPGKTDKQFIIKIFEPNFYNEFLYTGFSFES